MYTLDRPRYVLEQCHYTAEKVRSHFGTAVTIATSAYHSASFTDATRTRFHVETRTALL
jgi:hypothetical protein